MGAIASSQKEGLAISYVAGTVRAKMDSCMQVSQQVVSLWHLGHSGPLVSRIQKHMMLLSPFIFWGRCCIKESCYNMLHVLSPFPFSSHICLPRRAKQSANWQSRTHQSRPKHNKFSGQLNLCWNFLQKFHLECTRNPLGTVRKLQSRLRAFNNTWQIQRRKAECVFAACKGPEFVHRWFFTCGNVLPCKGRA